MSRLIVFSGPPCSGKSTYAAHFARALAIPHLEMDSIRACILPDAAHTRADREVAYRAMHLMAGTLIALGHGCILNASYSHHVDRDALERIGAPVFLIECHVTADAAVARSAARRATHPGLDLTGDRVRRLVAAFPFSGFELAVDSTRPMADCVTSIDRYLTAATPLMPGRWTASAAVQSEKEFP